MSNLKSRVAKLEEATGAGGDCVICHGDLAYYPEAIDTDDRYHAHMKCWKCGRPFTIIVKIVESRAA